MKEILTLQFGHYSNFVGTHWWNIQERGFEYNTNQPSEINHDVLYREGFTDKGQVTFTPRLLLVDLKGSLKSLPQQGELYGVPADTSKDVLWDQSLLEVKKDETKKKNQFQEDIENPSNSSKADYNLEDNVKVWSDFLYSRFHPKTVNVVKEYTHNSAENSFNVFPSGTSLWKTDYFQEDFSDKIRNYVEECDSFQGFHVLLDSTDGFGGLASSCLEYLNDDYDTKSILTVPVIPSYYEDYAFTTDEEKHMSLINDSFRVLNLVCCFEALSQYSSLFVPLSVGSTGWRQPGPKRNFYHTNYNHKLPYHSSAILASALENLTLKHRLRSEHFNLSDLASDLNRNGRKMAAASLCLPFSLNAGAELIDCLDKWEGPLSKSITPNCTLGSDRLMQFYTLRGISENRLKKPMKSAGKQKDMPAYSCKSVKDMLTFYMSCTNYACATDVTTLEKGLNVSLPFPKIFDEIVGINGNIQTEPRLLGIDVQSVPVLTGLHSGSEIGNSLESLHTEARKIKFARFHQFKAAGLESDDFTESLDRLFNLRECYEDNYVI